MATPHTVTSTTYPVLDEKFLKPMLDFFNNHTITLHSLLSGKDIELTPENLIWLADWLYFRIPKFSRKAFIELLEEGNEYSVTVSKR